MRPARPLHLETLEDRSVPASWGNPWPDAAHLTLSFAPDGTSAGGVSSTLFQTMSAGGNGAWQRQAARAIQAWAMHAALNVGVVPDGGQRFGVAGAPQGDARFGDVRVAATPGSPGVLAYTAPFDPLAGTLAGDVRLNSAVWGKPGHGYDLYTALLQEFGHALGLGNSLSTSSVMYEDYLGVRSGPSAADIAALQALYGARPADGYEGASGNSSLASATSVGLTNTDGVLSFRVEGDLTTLADRDVYRFNAPSLLGGLRVTLERAGYSLLTPRVTVYDGQGRVVGSASSTNPLGGDLVINLSGVTPLGTYYVAVEGASGDVFDVGGYGLSVESVPLLNNLLGSLGGTGQSALELLNNDLHTNDSFLTATLLAPVNALLGQATTTDARFDRAYRASLSDHWDVDYYQVQAPQTGAGDNALVVTAWRLGASNLQPRVSVYDANHQPLAAQALVQGDGTAVVQVVGAKPGANYYVKVEAASGLSSGGDNYFVGVDFAPRKVQLRSFAEGNLSAAQPSASGVMTVHHSASFHFVLAADGAAGTRVRLTIRDNAGLVVRTLEVAAGDAASMTLTLAPGTYTFRIDAYRPDGQPAGPVHFTLGGSRLTDPVGPRPTDTTEEPSQPPPSGGTSGSGDSTASGPYSTEEDYWYSWSSYDSSGGGVSPGTSA